MEPTEESLASLKEKAELYVEKSKAVPTKLFEVKLEEYLRRYHVSTKDVVQIAVVSSCLLLLFVFNCRYERYSRMHFLPITSGLTVLSAFL